MESSDTVLQKPQKSQECLVTAVRTSNLTVNSSSHLNIVRETIFFHIYSPEDIPRYQIISHVCSYATTYVVASVVKEAVTHPQSERLVTH
jgi:hypothetical protein